MLIFDGRWGDDDIAGYVCEMLDGQDPDGHGLKIDVEELIEFEE
jgi:hypothetical protein